MRMAEQNPVSHLLDGMVHCRRCNTPMATTGESFGETPKYVCLSSPEGCDTPDIPAEPLNRLVVERVIQAALEVENTKRVAETVQDDARQRSEEYRAAKFTVALASLNISHFDPLSPVRPPRRRRPELDPEMERLLRLDEGEYIEPLRRLDQYWSSTGDTGQIEQYALDLDTYLRPSNISTTKTIMDTAVDEIQVGRGSATIKYSIPMPPGSGAEGRTQEEVDLPS